MTFDGLFMLSSKTAYEHDVIAAGIPFSHWGKRKVERALKTRMKDEELMESSLVLFGHGHQEDHSFLQ